jgi:hypothetical protein
MESSIQHGYLLLADISGYTSYMAGTELEHCQAILMDLLDVIIGRLTPAMALAEVEGDAVFTFASQSAMPRGETLLELIESTYVAFRDRREGMRLRTTCTCNACREIPSLDLKFITHFGDYILQQITGKSKPVGSDVNLVHRLLKNNVTGSTGWDGYALFSEPALEAMGVRPGSAHEEVESYEHLGEIRTASINLHDRYRELKETSPIVLTPEEADVLMTHDFDAPPSVVWEWLNDPEKRTLWGEGVHWTGGDRPAGRTGPGARNHCAHGGNSLTETILDWRPFDYFTTENVQGKMRMTIHERFEPTDTGTRLHAFIKFDAPLPGWIRRPLFTFVMTKVIKMPRKWRNVDRLIREERETIPEGKKEALAA